jgi:CBS domain-containing protein
VREFRVFPSGGLDGLACRIVDLPLRPVPVVAAHLSMAAARKIAALRHISLLLVERDECLLGFCDEHALATVPDVTPIDAVTQPLGPCLRPGMSLAEGLELFLRARAAVLPVIAGGFVLGSVARGEVERAGRRLPASGR